MELFVEIPEGIKIELENFKIKVTGSKGTLEKDFYSPLFAKEIEIKNNDNKISITASSKRKKIKAMTGTIKSHILNMIEGVTEGYTVKLKMVYMHFPFTVKINGKEILVNNFLGEKTARKTTVVGDCKVEIKGDEIVVTGINKEDVGQTAANMERTTWIKARDRRVFQDGIFWLK
ncbi:50S ribosomal protein L6 [Candidatus Micrarchaeota archaeon RBG_16_36_9]|nr:MAG: 50S ribosomal protein L6 [Candidatus Micrarchaeota archaeon RBG_16_36_9]